MGSSNNAGFIISFTTKTDWGDDSKNDKNGVTQSEPVVKPETIAKDDVRNMSADSGGGSMLDNFQTGLDVAGIADPTGILDGFNALIYLGRGDWTNAGISALGIIPYIGDAGKAGRLGSKAFQLVTKTGTSVLGSYDKVTGGYVGLAKTLGANYFEIPSNIWAKMGPAEQWAANVKFLNRMIARGDNIILSNSAFSAKAGTSFYKELQYLYSQGFRPAANGMSLIKP